MSEAMLQQQTTGALRSLITRTLSSLRVRPAGSFGFYIAKWGENDED